MEYLFTSESVGRGHPDKIADRISDTITDAIVGQEPGGRTAIETFVTTGTVILGGEVKMQNPPTPEAVEADVRKALREIGCEDPMFHWERVRVENYIHEQSSDIAMGVDAGQDGEEGAGDQGLVFGYATDETKNFMPASIAYAHRAVEILEKGMVKYGPAITGGFGPDLKTQVTLRYEDGKPVGVETLLVSLQHASSRSLRDVREFVQETLRHLFPEAWGAPKNVYVNPTGRFVIGGPHGDAGLTGRKIIVDTYGGAAPHGGGAFSGKDPTKVDRSAAYMARYVAKNIVAAGLAKRVLLQLAYGIGMAEPISLYATTYGTGKIEDAKLNRLVREKLQFSPTKMRKTLSLDRPIYAVTASGGHFGRRPVAGFFPWEKLDLASIVQAWS